MKSYAQQRLKLRLDDLIMEMHLSKLFPPKEYYKILDGLRELFKEKIK